MLLSQIFFQPTKLWWAMLAQTPWLRYREFYDIGAGMGHLTMQMLEHGYPCIAYDLHERPGQYAVVELRDALGTYYPDHGCLILARPCHGDFPERVFRENCGYCEVLYVGLERNVEQDLAGMVYTLIMSGVGEDGEHCWRVIGPEEDCKPWYRLEAECWSQPGWMTEGSRNGGDWWLNAVGGGFPKGSIETKVLEERPLIGYHQLTQDPEQLVSRREDERSGWIEPSGKWWPVEYAGHSHFMDMVFGISEARAEEVGFVRCCGGNPGTRHYLCSRRPTAAQARTLRRVGYHVRDDHAETREVE